MEPIGHEVSGQGSPEDRDALVVLASVGGIGPITLERLLGRVGRPAQVLEMARGRDGARATRDATRDTRTGRPSLTAPAALELVAAARSAEEVLVAMRQADVHALTRWDSGYPRRLREIDLPPLVLFVRGSDAALESGAVVAVVGTRRPTDRGRQISARIGAALARAGALVISGLAIGIDGEAHAAVVRETGMTVAVIGGGHARMAPASHDRLADAIVDGGGAIVSEHAPGTEPTRGTFPRRNRIISGLSDAVVVVEAGARSGALLTAAWALEQGRECFFVPDSIDAPQSAGSLAWLRDYAGVARIVAGVPQLLEDLGLVPDPVREEANVPSEGPPASGLKPSGRATRAPSLEAVALGLPVREGALVRAIGAGATTADEVAALTGLAIGAVLGGLTVLEHRGLVESLYGRIRLTDDP